MAFDGAIKVEGKPQRDESMFLYIWAGSDMKEE